MLYNYFCHSFSSISSRFSASYLAASDPPARRTQAAEPASNQRICAREVHEILPLVLTSFFPSVFKHIAIKIYCLKRMGCIVFPPGPADFKMNASTADLSWLPGDADGK